MSTLSEKIAKAVSFVEGLDLENHELGKFIIDDDMYYMVQSYDTIPQSEGKLEAHRKYIDIQWIIKGEEKIMVCGLDGLTIKDDYNPDKDVIFYNAPERMMEVVLRDNSYVVLYPENAHMPKVSVAGSTTIKKIVVKVKM